MEVSDFDLMKKLAEAKLELISELEKFLQERRVSFEAVLEGVKQESKLPNRLEFSQPIPMDFRPLGWLKGKVLDRMNARYGIPYRLDEQGGMVRGVSWGECDEKRNKEIRDAISWVGKTFKKEAKA